MRKHRKLLLVLLCLAALVVIAALLFPAGEPTYQGQPLSYWVDRYGASTYVVIRYEVTRPTPPDKEAAAAISHIGTNALPFLLARIRYEPAEHPVRAVVASLLRRTPAPFRFKPLVKWASVDPRATFAAAIAFAPLGPSARPAIPELVRIMNDRTRKESAHWAQGALAYTGKDALPTLVALLQDPNAPNRASAAALFSSIPGLYTNAAPAIPTLLTCLQDKDPDVQCHAATALGKASLEPDLVVPALLTSVRNSTNPTLRLASLGALADFGPRARAAEPDILAAQNDPDKDIRGVAGYALFRIHLDPLTNAPPP